MIFLLLTSLNLHARKYSLKHLNNFSTREALFEVTVTPELSWPKCVEIDHEFINVNPFAHN